MRATDAAVAAGAGAAGVADSTAEARLRASIEALDRVRGVEMDAGSMRVAWMQ